ncbi:MAG: sugar transferase [Halorhabdus sp.]
MKITGGRYRLASVTGVAVLTVATVVVANSAPVQTFVTSAVPLLNRLQPTVLSGEQFTIAVTMTLVVVAIALSPLYKPQPRRVLNVVYHTHCRVTVAGFALATIGYFDWSYRLPRATLIVTIATLFVMLPVWFVSIRRRPADEAHRAVIVGDDPEEIDRILHAIDAPVLGYISSPTSLGIHGERETGRFLADGIGGAVEHERPPMDLTCLGGLSRLESVIVDNDVDTTVFAFNETDREEFFGILATCHEHGVDAKIHRDHADSVLVSDGPGEELVDVDVEPWDWQERLVKRAFDVAFSAVGLIAASPLMVAIAVAIKLDSDGPVLYSQERTAELGETFTVYKFRSMAAESENAEPGEDDSRITRVGRFLRRTHLDEIPQLWSILTGNMSAVGPRATWSEEEYLLEADVDTWRQRWFVKPGLTGLAQINDVTSEEPERKLRYDVEYIRQQSFHFDVAIVLRQVWQVLEDVAAIVTGREER